MFVALYPYKGKYKEDCSKVLILDTSDFKLEYVPVNILRDSVEKYSDIEYINYELFTGFSFEYGCYDYKYGGLYDIFAYIKGLYVIEINTGTIITNSPWRYAGKLNFDIEQGNNYYKYRFGDYKVTLKYKNFRFELRSIKDAVPSYFDMDSLRVHYAFKFKDYMVIRFVNESVKFAHHFSVSVTTNWFTIVLDSKSKVICTYTDAGILYGDKSLMSRIELVCEY